MNKLHYNNNSNNKIIIREVINKIAITIATIDLVVRVNTHGLILVS